MTTTQWAVRPLATLCFVFALTCGIAVVGRNWLRVSKRKRPLCLLHSF